MNLIRCQVAGVNGSLQLTSEEGQVQLDVPLETATREPTTPSALLGIRCEHVHEDPNGPIAGRVVTEEYLGAARIVHVDTPCGRLIVRADRGRERTLGSQVRLRLDAGEVSMFDGATEARL
jgi:ABC-type sugar transport system ATPase subunit